MASETPSSSSSDALRLTSAQLAAAARAREYWAARHERTLAADQHSNPDTAMRTKPDDSTTKTKNQGEGDREAARRFNEDQKRFVESGAVDDAARQAQPRDDEQADEMLDAERIGRDKAKGEDPTVPGANARRQRSAKR
jgi:hypothetical protein